MERRRKRQFCLTKNVLRGAIDAEKAICSGIQLSFRMDASKLPMVMNSQPDLFWKQRYALFSIWTFFLWIKYLRLLTAWISKNFLSMHLNYFLSLKKTTGFTGIFFVNGSWLLSHHYLLTDTQILSSLHKIHMWYGKM